MAQLRVRIATCEKSVAVFSVLSHYETGLDSGSRSGLLGGVAVAKPVVGNVERAFVFGKDLPQEKYAVVVEIPNGFKDKQSFGRLSVEKSFFEELKFEMVSSIAEHVAINSQSWKVSDKTAKSEVLLVTQTGPGREIRFYFNVYRRLDPRQAKPIIRCHGSANSKGTFEAMVAICRSARLK